MATLALVFLAFFANKIPRSTPKYSTEAHINIHNCQQTKSQQTVFMLKNSNNHTFSMQTKWTKSKEISALSFYQELIRISHTQSEASALAEHAKTISRTRKMSTKIHVHNSNFIFPKPVTVRSIESNGILYAYYPEHTHARSSRTRNMPYHSMVKPTKKICPALSGENVFVCVCASQFDF